MEPDEQTLPAGSGEETAVVTLTIPCAPEYVGTARLTILGVASRMGFTYDQIEDIRLAVGEACANAIDRAAANGGSAADATITIRSHVDAAQLVVEVEDRAGGVAEGMIPAEDISVGPDTDKHELGALLMEILVDEVSVDALPAGARVRLVKYVAEV